MEKHHALLMEIDTKRDAPVTFSSQQDSYRKVVARITLRSTKKK